jgi:hypothetical protein
VTAGWCCDLDQELELLESDLQRHLGRLPVVLVAAAEALPDRLRIRPGSDGGWVRRLSPLVVLYPLLLSEGLTVPRSSARRTALAHALLLLYAFVDDHDLDGQVELRREDKILSRQILQEGLHLLRVLAPARTEQLLQRVLLRYHQAQSERLSSNASLGPGADRRRLRIVAGRALLGLAAPLALAATDASGATLRLVTRCFSRLALGLQWEDDLKDWPMDIRRSQENLLLLSLPQTPDRGTPADDRSLEAIESELARSGAYDLAVAAAASELRRSASLHRSLGCERLGRLIEQRADEVLTFGSRLRRELSAAGTPDPR